MIIKMNYYAHPTAVIDEGCVIGDGTKIWHFCHLMPGAVVGKNCVLGQNVFVADRVVLGNGVKVQNNVSLYEGVICEDDVFIGPSAVFTNVVNPRGAVSRKAKYKKTVIQKGATVGANATILCGIVVGAYAFIGAGTVVTKDIPDYALIVGNPGKQTGWMSEYGCRLLFDDNEEAICVETGERYLLKEGKVTKV